MKTEQEIRERLESLQNDSSKYRTELVRLAEMINPNTEEIAFTRNQILSLTGAANALKWVLGE